MTEDMSLNTKLVQLLLTLNEGDDIKFENVPIEVWRRVDYVVFVNDVAVRNYKEPTEAADYLEGIGITEANFVIGAPVEVVEYELRIEQRAGTEEPAPTEDNLRQALHGGLIAAGFKDISAIGVRRS